MATEYAILISVTSALALTVGKVMADISTQHIDKVVNIFKLLG